MTTTYYGTHLVVTWPPNNTGLPPDDNPAYNPLRELQEMKLTEMKNAKQFGNVLLWGNGVTVLEFVDSASASEYQNYLTEVLVDLNQALPQFVIQPAGPNPN